MRAAAAASTGCRATASTRMGRPARAGKSRAGSIRRRPYPPASATAGFGRGEHEGLDAAVFHRRLDRGRAADQGHLDVGARVQAALRRHPAHRAVLCAADGANADDGAPQRGEALGQGIVRAGTGALQEGVGRDQFERHLRHQVVDERGMAGPWRWPRSAVSLPTAARSMSPPSSAARVVGSPPGMAAQVSARPLRREAVVGAGGPDRQEGERGIGLADPDGVGGPRDAGQERERCGGECGAAGEGHGLPVRSLARGGRQRRRRRSSAAAAVLAASTTASRIAMPANTPAGS